mmetsp:Transcript_6474/g.16553  ORF Transcript_6474/g.16553 Transcript_6474/m.16553 type:complete len:379 (+) Transcript_6474:397-1533(+)
MTKGGTFAASGSRAVAKARSRASTAHSTSLTGRSPAGSSSTGTERGRPNASWSVGGVGAGGGRVVVRVVGRVAAGARSAAPPPVASAGIPSAPLPYWTSSSSAAAATAAAEAAAAAASAGEGGMDTPWGMIMRRSSPGSDPGGAASTMDPANATTRSTVAARRLSVAALSGAEPASTLTSVPPSTSTTGGPLLSLLLSMCPSDGCFRSIVYPQVSAAAAAVGGFACDCLLVVYPVAWSMTSPHLKAWRTTTRATSAASRNCVRPPTGRGEEEEREEEGEEEEGEKEDGGAGGGGNGVGGNMSGVARMVSKPDSAATNAAMRPMVTPLPPSASPAEAGSVGATSSARRRQSRPTPAGAPSITTRNPLYTAFISGQKLWR